METERRTRKRIPKSCRRCHRRKQRCVGHPICANCESANHPCSRAESAPSWHHGMSKGALAQRIEILEAQLAAALGGAETSTADSPESDASKSQLHGVVRFLTLGSEESEEPHYLGPSSGLSIAECLSRIVHNAVGSKLLPINAGNQPDSMVRSQSKVTPPDDKIGDQILDAYFKNMHIRLPFLDHSEILHLHANRHQSPGPSPQEQFGRFKIFMVYAIGAAILQMTETYDSTSPNDFLVTALQFDPTLRESISITSIEAMMLLVLYNLRSSSNSSVWYMIGLAMRICVDFGFHREAHYQNLSPREAQLRRCLFWSVYIIERYTAWSLGRPFSIAEEEVDAEPPLNMNYTLNDGEGMDKILHSPLTTSEIARKPTLGRFIASIQLQRIVSQIHTRIYRVDKTVSILVPEITPLLASLEDFKQSLPSLDLGDREFVRMHWNNAIRSLLQPFLNILHPQDKLIGTCLSASGQMCQFFKRLRQRDSSGYSFLLVNSVFMSGLTMCFCLFRSPTLWSPAVSNDLRACSSALFVMAERNPRLKRYRDGLETIINRAMEFVQDASGATHGVNEMPVQANNICQQQTLPPPAFRVSPSLDSMHMLHSQPLPPDIDHSHGTGVFHTQNSDIFAEFPAFLNDLPDGLEGGAEMPHPFHGAFTEEVWAADDLAMLDILDWAM